MEMVIYNLRNLVLFIYINEMLGAYYLEIVIYIQEKIRNSQIYLIKARNLSTLFFVEFQI